MATHCANAKGFLQARASEDCYSRSCVVPPIQGPVLHRLGDMGPADGGASIEIGQGAGHFENAAVGPCREAQRFKGPLQEALTLGDGTHRGYNSHRR